MVSTEGAARMKRRKGVSDSTRKCHERSRVYAEALKTGASVRAGAWDFDIRILREHLDVAPISTGNHMQEGLYELSVMNSGSMEYRIGGKLVEIEASRGDWVLIPAGALHCRTCVSAPAVIFGYLLALSCPPDGRWSRAKLDREIARSGFHFPGSPSLSKLHSEILAEAGSSLPLKAERVSLLIRDLLLCFLREAFPGFLDSPSERHDEAAAALGLMCSNIEENIARDIGLSEIAASCGLSPRHANRIFARSLGVSIGRYVLERRMELARRRLEETTLQVKEIALGLGYDDISYFNRVFKRQFKATPLQCRARKPS